MKIVQPQVVGEPNILLGDLAPLAIWCAWTEEPRPDGKARKPPRNPATDRHADVGRPATWGTLPTARRRAQRLGNGRASGVGLMLGPLPDRPGWTLAGVDLDRCRDAETGELAPWAKRVLDRLGTYAEVSPSGNGAHTLFLCRGSDVATARTEG